MFDDGMRSCLEENKHLKEVINSLQVERSKHLKQIEQLKLDIINFKGD